MNYVPNIELRLLCHASCGWPLERAYSYLDRNRVTPLDQGDDAARRALRAKLEESDPSLLRARQLDEGRLQQIVEERFEDPRAFLGSRSVLLPMSLRVEIINECYALDDAFLMGYAIRDGGEGNGTLDGDDSALVARQRDSLRRVRRFVLSAYRSNNRPPCGVKEFLQTAFAFRRDLAEKYAACLVVGEHRLAIRLLEGLSCVDLIVVCNALSPWLGGSQLFLCEAFCVQLSVALQHFREGEGHGHEKGLIPRLSGRSDTFRTTTESPSTPRHSIATFPLGPPVGGEARRFQSVLHRVLAGVGRRVSTQHKLRDALEYFDEKLGLSTPPRDWPRANVAQHLRTISQGLEHVLRSIEAVDGVPDAAVAAMSAFVEALRLIVQVRQVRLEVAS